MSIESDWIGTLLRRFGANTRGLRTGIGSDCAVLDTPGAPVIVSTDTQVEGVHFDALFMTWEDAGYRAIACALSDLAAGGADPALPLLVFVSAAFPNRLTAAEREALAGGIGQALGEYGVTLAGGDTVLTPGPTVITASVMGQAPKPLTRSGAQVGDEVWVAGACGGAGAALRLLHLQQARLEDDALLLAYRRPAALLDVGHRLAAAGVTACADVSDGLLLDASRVAAQSGVAMDIELDGVPIHESLAAHPLFTDEERLRLAATFGDDYALVFTVPPEKAATASQVVRDLGRHCERVGVCVKGSGVRSRWRGQDYTPSALGYEH